MTLSLDTVTDLHPALRGAPSTTMAGPLAWQRTDTVGTELVLPSGADNRSADGTAVVAGPVPHTTRFHADLDTRSAVRTLTVTCSGSGWSRTLCLSRDADGGWACRTEETGDLRRSLTGSGHAAPPPPGIDDPIRLHGATIVRLDQSPVFITWALRQLDLTSGEGPSTVPTVRVLTPSLVVAPTLSTYQLITAHRLRVSGPEPSALYHLDQHGVVTYQPARVRLVR
jgi:hypothetical protein